MALDIVRLTADHHVLTFECGEDDLDRHLKATARKQNEDCIATTYVAVDRAEPAMVRGFYCLRMGEIGIGSKPPGIKKLKSQAMPAVIVNYFGVHKAAQGQRVGETMLFDLYRRAQVVSENVGCHAVCLEAINDKVIGFYTKYSMKQIGSDPKKLWIPITTIKEFGLV